MIDLKPKYLKIVKDILSRSAPECEVRVFGSRVNGKAKPYSDLDLALVGKRKLDWRRIEDIKDALSASQIPIMVDVLDWHAISDNFKKIIESRYEVLQKPRRSRDSRGAARAKKKSNA